MDSCKHWATSWLVASHVAVSTRYVLSTNPKPAKSRDAPEMAPLIFISYLFLLRMSNNTELIIAHLEGSAPLPWPTPWSMSCLIHSPPKVIWEFSKLDLTEWTSFWIVSYIQIICGAGATPRLVARQENAWPCRSKISDHNSICRKALSFALKCPSLAYQLERGIWLSCFSYFHIVQEQLFLPSLLLTSFPFRRFFVMIKVGIIEQDFH